MTRLYVHEHPLGILVQSHLSDAHEQAILGDVSELVCAGDVFGGLTFDQIKELAQGAGEFDADQLKVD